MSQTLCARCRLRIVLEADCAWSRLSMDQRKYLETNGVSPSKYCGYRAVEYERWSEEQGLGDGIKGFGRWDSSESVSCLYGLDS